MGPGNVVVDTVGALDRAGPGSLSLLTSPRYTPSFVRSRAGAVLVVEALAGIPGGPATRIVVADPHRAMRDVVAKLFPPAAPAGGIDPTARLGPGIILGDQVSVGPLASIGADVRLGDRVRVGPAAVIEDKAEIGDDTVVGPHVVVGPGTRIGNRVVIKAGAVLGTTGFGYVSGPAGHERVSHVGGCVIGDDVDIGANTCIDRGSLDDTVIGDGTKIDNLVHIAHNVRIGRRCLVMAGVGIAGSTRIGDGVVLAGQVGVAGHLTVGDGVRAAAQAGIAGDIPAGETVTGFPARPNREFLRSQAVLYRLVPIIRDLEALVETRRADA